MLALARGREYIPVMMKRAPIGLALACVATLLSSCGKSHHSAPPVPPSAPVIASVTPSGGAVGTAVTISGAEFEQAASFEVVFFDDTEAAITAANPAEIVCSVPPGVGSGAHAITVTTRRATSAGAAFTVNAGGGGAPTVSKVVPQAGPPGTVVTVTGTNFSTTAGANTVLLANGAVQTSSASATQLTFTVPAGARAGKVAVSANSVPSTTGATFWVTGAPPKSPGASSPGEKNVEFAAASPFTHMVIEMDVQQNLANDPAITAINTYLGVIGSRLQKPGGILFVQKAHFAPVTSGDWSDALIAQQEKMVRGAFDGPNAATLHFLVVGQGYQPSNGVIGLTYSASSIAVFEDKVPGNAQAERAAIEAPVMVHETGHTLGLVGITTPMQTPHEDPTSAGHDVSSACVMFREIDVPSIIVNVVTNPPPTDFDAHCVEDLRAIGGK